MASNCSIDYASINTDENNFAVSTDTATDELNRSLKAQHRYEVNGADLKNPERFMLDQKFGLVDPVLTQSELDIIRAEEARLGRS